LRPEKPANFSRLAHEREHAVDTKKKELIGDFKNAGQEWQPKGRPEHVRVHDFIDKELGKAVPYGVYDVANNVGWVSVGTDHDTAEFAVETIARWWREMGRALHPNAKELLITADGGGSNSSRTWLWKLELQKLADTTNLIVSVCHYLRLSNTCRSERPDWRQVPGRHRCLTPDVAPRLAST
jgi:hypothetical protein